jgi:Leucine-rich repeat (LRR) protein
MTGFLPTSLVNLTMIQTISFFNNTLQGTVPSMFGDMLLLTSLDLGYNEFIGTIPRALNALVNLRVLYINRNHLSGALPTLDSVADFIVLYLSKNHLTGTIPSLYARFTSMITFHVGQNMLNGTLPAFLGTMSNLTTLELYANAFTGTLPDVSGLSQLNSLLAASNRLHGAVPAYFGRMPSLQTLVLTENHYTGTIPAELSESKTLQQLYLNINELSGSLPKLFSTVTTLTSFRVGFNQLTGTIPVDIADAANMTLLSFASNRFTGTLPSSVGKLALLQKLDVSDNLLTGSIPASVSQLTAMLNFTASGCLFTGPIPADIGNMTRVQVLALNGNFLTSTLPASLKRAKELTILLLHSNQLIGPLSGAFDPASQTALSTVQLSENGFTGNIPEDLFALPFLQTAILGTNCLQGTLPATMCEALNLRTLSLNGLHSGAPCREPLFPKISDAYLASHSVKTGIPSCLFEMPSLGTLQLSGNGIKGSLPADIKIGANLIALALSHNKLTGTIPHVFQHRIWDVLDLSKNKLKGTLSGDFATILPNITASRVLYQYNSSDVDVEERYHSAASVDLFGNRLSHRIPDILVDMLNISILSGNLFDCYLDRSDLPGHDHGRYAYTCGSNSFNASYLAYLCCTFFVLVAGALCYHYRQSLSAYMDIVALARAVKSWTSFSSLHRDQSGQVIMRRYEGVQSMADELCRIGAYCTAYILIIQLPLSVAFSKEYGTHTFEYAWSVSIAYLSGDAATAFLMVTFAALLVLLLYCFQRAMEAMKQVYKEARRQDSVRSLRLIPDEREATTSPRKWAIFSVYLAVNITIVSLVDVGYLYVIIHASAFNKTLAELALSAFRLVWSTYGTPHLIRGVQRRLAKSESEFWKMKDARFFYLQLLIQLLNTVVIPGLVVLLVSSDCFHYALVSPRVITATYVYDDCQIFIPSVGCVAPDYRIASTTFHPPFTYSYECSASLITYYAPALVYTALFVTFLSPVLDLARCYLFTSVSRESRWFGIVDSFVPKILRPVSAATVQYDKIYDPLRPYFDANNLLLTVTSYLGLLLTFGFVFPPLAFVLLLSMYSTVYLSRFHVGRFLTSAVADDLHQYVERVEKECMGISWRFLRCVRVLMAVMAGFYALFAFDTLGDTHGAKVAIAIVIVVFAIPLLLWGGVLLRDKYVTNRANERDLSVLSGAMNEPPIGIELGNSGDGHAEMRGVNIVEGTMMEADRKDGRFDSQEEHVGTVKSAMHS